MVLRYMKPRILENLVTKKDIRFTLKNVRHRTVQLHTTDKEIVNCWLISPKKINTKTKIAFFLHGNRSNRQTFCEGFEIDKKINEYNLILLVLDYRDFGDSSGSFNKHDVNYDVHAAMQFLRKTFDVNSVSLIGHSLGTGILLEYNRFVQDLYKSFNIDFFKMEEIDQVNSIEDDIYDARVIEDSGEVSNTSKYTNARNYFNITKMEEFFDSTKIHEYKALHEYGNKIDKIILIAPYTSITDVLSEYPKWNYAKKIIPFLHFIVDKELNYENLKNIKFANHKNVIVVHGKNDNLIKVDMGIQIADKIGARKIITQDNHTSIVKNAAVWESIMQFI